MGRLLLTANSRVNEILGAMTDTYTVKSDHPVLRSMQDAGSHYSSQARGKSPAQHGLGAPTGYIVEAFFRSILDQPFKDGWDSAMQADLQTGKAPPLQSWWSGLPPLFPKSVPISSWCLGGPCGHPNMSTFGVKKT